MKGIKFLKNIARNSPILSKYGYHIIKNYWAIKSEIINYDYPKDTNKADISLEDVIKYNKNRILGPQKRICYAPFNNMHFTNFGKVTSCSFNFSHYIGDVSTTMLKEIWFGESVKVMQNTLGNYDFSKCIDCKIALKAGNYPSFPPSKYDIHNSNTSEYPTQMSFEISNLCNLECIMCDGNFSSLIRKNRERKQPLMYKYPENFVEQLEDFIPYLKIATFIGGEPFLIKAYYDIWELIIKLNPSCVIHIQTNATIITDRFRKLLDKGNFEIGISIDAINKETFENIRLNAKYEEVMKNINEFVNLQKTKKIHLNFNFCFMPNNWNELPDMIEYANSKNVSLKLIHVTRPYHLSIRNYRPKQIEYIYTMLSKTVFKKNENFIAKKNIESFKYLLNDLELDVQLSEKKYNWIVENNSKENNEIKKEYEVLLLNMNYLSKCTKDEIVILLQRCNKFIDINYNNETTKKNIYLHLIYNIIEYTDENNLLQSSIDDLFETFVDKCQSIANLINN